MSFLCCQSRIALETGILHWKCVPANRIGVKKIYVVVFVFQHSWWFKLELLKSFPIIPAIKNPVI